MGKWVASQVLDGALQVIAGSNRMLAVNGQPATFAAAWAARLAEAPMAAGDFGFAAGDVSGRKIEVAGKLAMPVTTAGLADHVALVDSVGSRLLYVTTCPPQALAAGGTVNFDGWSVEIGAPI